MDRIHFGHVVDRDGGRFLLVTYAEDLTDSRTDYKNVRHLGPYTGGLATAVMYFRQIAGEFINPLTHYSAAISRAMGWAPRVLRRGGRMAPTSPQVAS